MARLGTICSRLTGRGAGDEKREPIVVLDELPRGLHSLMASSSSSAVVVFVVPSFPSEWFSFAFPARPSPKQELPVTENHKSGSHLSKSQTLFGGKNH